MNLVNGAETDAINANDRGLAYGDGIFRTFMMRDGHPSQWRRQYSKLAQDCAALRITCPPAVVLEGDLAAVAAREPECVVKIIVTRGRGDRGYRIPGESAAQRIVLSFPQPQYPAAHYTEGVRVRWCDTRLAVQPQLAGIKHLNRLENVLARSEWTDAGIAEGLMCDIDHHVICGTMTNLFVLKARTLLTPDLTRCGVAGVQRERVLELARRQHVPSQIAIVNRADVLAAEEVFLVNSIIGVWQVQSIEHRVWKAGAMTAEIRSWLEQERDD